MKTIVALVDFSDVTNRLVEQATKIARAFDGSVILLHVVPEEPAVVELGLASPTIMQPPSEKKIEAHYHRLLELRDSLTAAGAKVTAQQLEDAGIEKVVEACRELGAELIVVGSHVGLTTRQLGRLTEQHSSARIIEIDVEHVQNIDAPAASVSPGHTTGAHESSTNTMFVNVASPLLITS